MRTRMSGGVAGERRCSVMLTVVPYADRTSFHEEAAFELIVT
jgi:hypothetical protein